jgi:23S rRNA (adenine2503-C2)-methyltransferase
MAARNEAELAPLRDSPFLTDWPLDAVDRLKDLPGVRSFHPAAIRRWIWQRGAADFAAMSDLPAAVREDLAARYRVRSSHLALESLSDDGTTKLLIELRDGRTIESVIIPDADRRTLCVSTQVGCGVRCAFCASGLDGVVRNLTPGEILEQFLIARDVLAPTGLRITNVVLMGGGEPLNNFEHVKAALDVLNAKDGIGFGARRITLSTIGIPAKIDRLEELGKQVTLAVSLHAPNETLRGRLIPGLDRIPLDDVLAAAHRYFERTGREVTFEYVVIRDVNDSEDCARELASRVRGMRANVNLIPLNPVAETGFARPSDAAVERMREILEKAGIRTTVRRSRGRDIDAACGQLRRRLPTGAAAAAHAAESAPKEPPARS